MVRLLSSSSSLALLALVLVALAASGAAFYLPGVAPREYMEGRDNVALSVNKLVSSVTQIPYEYYSLNFCPPAKIELMHENLGEFLLGDRIENSPYLIVAGNKVPCKVLCTRPQTPEQLADFEKRIREEYTVNWIVDNLPAAVKKTTLVGTQSYTIYQPGFPLGSVVNDVAYLNNHVNMKIVFHKSADFEGMRIVRFEVAPQSILHDDDWTGKEAPDSCRDPPAALPVSGPDAPSSITFTYSIEWEEDPNQRWATRWDVYLTVTDSQIHWVAIINSVMIAFFLTAMVAMIMMRTLRADLRRYHEMETQEEAQEETGWKLVHGDVFRPPSHPLMLSVLVGSGVQVISMSTITLVFALLGFLSPANRGGLMTAMVVLYVLMGIFAGYFSARTYKAFKGQHWKKNTLLTALLFPGACFVIFFILNLVLKYEQSSGFVPFSIMFGIFCLWFGVSIPLAFMGSYLGFKKPAPENPVRTNQIPRQIPEQVWYMQPWASCLMGGILPFGAVFIEMFFIMSSIWNHQFYYMFSFLFIVFIILALTCAEITIVMCYFQLCSEDYHWWWRSYLTSGTSALYMFLYAVFYFTSKLHITKFVSALLYFGYTTIMTLAFFVLTGTMGFYSCYWFVRKIYASVKVD